MAYDGSTSWMWSLCLSTFSGLATGIGGLIAVWRRPDDQQLACLLGIAIGVMLCLSVVEMLVLNAMRMGVLMVTTAFASGSGFYFGSAPFFPEFSVEHPEEDQENKAGVMPSGPPRQAKVSGESFAFLSPCNEEQAGAGADNGPMNVATDGSQVAGSQVDSYLLGGGSLHRSHASPHRASNQHHHHHALQELPGGSLHGAYLPPRHFTVLERSQSLSSVTGVGIGISSSGAGLAMRNAVPTMSGPAAANLLQSTAPCAAGKPGNPCSSSATPGASLVLEALAQPLPSPHALPAMPVPASDWSLVSTHDPLVPLARPGSMSAHASPPLPPSVHGSSHVATGHLISSHAFAPGLLQRGASGGTLVLLHRPSLLDNQPCPGAAVAGMDAGWGGGSVRVTSGGDELAPPIPDYLADLAPHWRGDSGCGTDGSSGTAFQDPHTLTVAGGERLCDAPAARGSNQGLVAGVGGESLGIPPVAPAGDSGGGGVAFQTPTQRFSIPNVSFLGHAGYMLVEASGGAAASSVEGDRHSNAGAGMVTAGGKERTATSGLSGNASGGGNLGGTDPLCGGGGESGSDSPFHGGGASSYHRGNTSVLQRGHVGRHAPDDLDGQPLGSRGWAWGMLSLPGRLFRRRGDTSAHHSSNNGVAVQVQGRHSTSRASEAASTREGGAARTSAKDSGGGGGGSNTGSVKGGGMNPGTAGPMGREPGPLFSSLPISSTGVAVAGSRKKAKGRRPAELLRLGFLMAFTMTVHNLPEGFAVAMAAYTNFGVVMAVAVAVHNIPEGIIVAAPVYAATNNRWQAFGMAVASGLSEPLGAVLALTVVRPFLTETRLQFILAFVGGIMFAVCFSELIPEGMRCRHNRDLIKGIVLGATVMGMTLYVGV
eukprot:jgi/Mesvir1/4901/Mv11163-RA.1